MQHDHRKFGKNDGPSGAIESYRRYLLVVARKRMGASLCGADDASDMVQEALIAAHHARDSARGPGGGERDMKRWLAAILDHKIKQSRRKDSAGKRGGGVEIRPFLEEPNGEGTSPSQAAIRGEEEARLREAMGRISEADRQLIVWAYREGKTRREIAELLGCSASYASRACDRAGTRLREAFLAGQRAEETVAEAAGS